MIYAYPLLITNPGVVIQLTSADTGRCHSYMIQAYEENVGRVWIGKSNLNVSTKTGILHVLGIPTSNLIPTWGASVEYAPVAVDARELYIDVESPGDGVYLVTMRG